MKPHPLTQLMLSDRTKRIREGQVTPAGCPEPIDLVKTLLGQAVMIARLKKKLKDREDRLRYLNDRQALVGWDDGTARLDVQRATDLMIRNWKPKGDT